MTDNIKIVIDGVETEVPKGTLVIRAAEQIGVEIPRFCDHPLLEPAGACRQCLVEVETPGRDGGLQKMPKPQASCTLEATPGMVVHTQNTSPVADKAQKGVLELLLVNHPLDCPICDKGGECPLQNQAMSHGHTESRFQDVKRTFTKPISISTQILLDRERCVLCQRCTRFSKQIAGDAFIDLQKRGASQQIGRFDEDVLGFAKESVGGCGSYSPKDLVSVESSDVSGLDEAELKADALANTPAGEAPLGAAQVDESGQLFSSYFSGNTVQICPVGALTSAAYRFRSRPFDLVSTPSISEHDSSGSAVRIDHRRGTILRRLSGNDPVVNEEWITDKDRFAFTWQQAPGRITKPMIRETLDDGTRGELKEASWKKAIEFAAQGLRSAGTSAVLPGGRLTIEDNFAYSKFARVALGTNNIDFRARAHSEEELAFLGAQVAGTSVGVTFNELEAASAVLLVGFEAEEEGGVVFLRLRKAARKNGLKAFAIAPFATRGLQRIGNAGGTLIKAAPGSEAEVLTAIGTGQGSEEITAAHTTLGDAGDKAIIIVGERLAQSTGGYSAALKLAAQTGAKIAWIPRRAGERGGVEMGALPTLLPGGRPVSDTAARVDIAAAWGVATLPETQGLDLNAILDSVLSGETKSLVVGGLELADLPRPSLAKASLEAAQFVVSLEVRTSAVTELADVVFPVAPPSERAGSFWNWEGRVRPFARALETSAETDHRVLSMLADELGAPINVATLEAVRADIDSLGYWDGARIAAPTSELEAPQAAGPGQAILATWHQLIDAGALQIAERYLAGTAKNSVARISAKTAAEIGVADGQRLSVSTTAGTITLPAAVTEMADGVVWLPIKSANSFVHQTLEATAGDVVNVSAASTSAEGIEA